MVDPEIVSGKNFWRRVMAYRNGAHAWRQCDPYIKRRLREYDPRLDVRWSFVAGSWCLWRLTPRFVPQGRVGERELYITQDVPQLVLTFDEDPSLRLVQWVGEHDIWRHGRQALINQADTTEDAYEDAVNKKVNAALTAGAVEEFKQNQIRSFGGM